MPPGVTSSWFLTQYTKAFEFVHSLISPLVSSPTLLVQSYNYNMDEHPLSTPQRWSSVIVIPLKNTQSLCYRREQENYRDMVGLWLGSRALAGHAQFNSQQQQNNKKDTDRLSQIEPS